MKNERGFTLFETLIAMVLIVMLSGAGLTGWQRWQAQQQLWQTARQVRDYLVQLRNDANGHNREHIISLRQAEGGWCLLTNDLADCQAESTQVMVPRWPGIVVAEITPSLGFYGLKDTAWAGRIRLQSRAGEWLVIVSNGGRIRMCSNEGGDVCR